MLLKQIRFFFFFLIGIEKSIIQDPEWESLKSSLEMPARSLKVSFVVYCRELYHIFT